MTALLSRIKTTLCAALVLSVTAVPSMAAGLPLASDVFVGAPRDVLPLLEKRVRLDMVDYFNSGMSTPSKNILEGAARVTSISPEVVSLESSGSERYTIAVLPAGKSFVIAVIQTLALPEADSNIRFYDAKWRKLDSDKYLSLPDVKDWLTPQGRKNRIKVDAVVPFVTAEYSYDPMTGELVMTQQVAKTIGTDAYDDVKDSLKPVLTYKWKGGKFKLQ